MPDLSLIERQQYLGVICNDTVAGDTATLGNTYFIPPHHWIDEEAFKSKFLFTKYAFDSCSSLRQLYEVLDMTFFTSYHDVKEDKYIAGSEYNGEENIRAAIAVSYWGFTTLTTIGLGDYHPRSDYERLLCAVIFLVGVSIQSIIMGNFMGILTDYLQMTAGLDDGDNLTKFFGCLKKYNYGKEVSAKFRNDCESFFEYSW
jgi:hypothetical protein